MRVSAAWPLFLCLLTACSKTPGLPSINTTDDVAQIRALLKHIEDVFDAGDLDAAVAVFAEDAVILSQGSPDAVGKGAVRAVYAGALASTSLRVRFHTEEIESRGDLAYERGTYDLGVTDKATGRELGTVTNRYVHIFRKQPNGEWRTWRMFTNNGANPAAKDGSAMLTKEFAENFAREWIESWNSHDLDRILSHYADDFVMSSPRIAKVANEPSGVLRGKGAVGAYWKRALELTPNLEFQLLATFVGSDSVALYYRGPRGPSVETLFFGADGRVVRASANYDSQSAG